MKFLDMIGGKMTEKAFTLASFSTVDQRPKIPTCQDASQHTTIGSVHAPSYRIAYLPFATLFLNTLPKKKKKKKKKKYFHSLFYK